MVTTTTINQAWKGEIRVLGWRRWEEGRGPQRLYALFNGSLLPYSWSYQNFFNIFYILYPCFYYYYINQHELPLMSLEIIRSHRVSSCIKKKSGTVKNNRVFVKRKERRKNWKFFGVNQDLFLSSIVFFNLRRYNRQVRKLIVIGNEIMKLQIKNK